MQSKEMSNFFVLIDNSEVNNACIQKTEEWLEAYGEILKKMANSLLKDIIRDTEEYEKKLKGEMGDIDQLKSLLNVISEIKNKSMDMEFRIIEVQEQFRVLNMYDFAVEEETQKDVDALMVNWDELLEFADKKDFEVNDFKKNFAEVTKQDVANFKIKILAEYEKYKSHGPGTLSVQLAEGIELLSASKEQIRKFNKEREDNVLAEKLFNLPISKFPELVFMEEENKKFDKIYDIYKDYSTAMKEFALMSWLKLDMNNLEQAAIKYERDTKKLVNKLPGAESMFPYTKLRDTISGFKESLPLIQMLKQPAV
jgi:dynein heavy chain